MTHSKRDANEAAIVSAWRALGCVWVPMARWAGFDGLLLWRGQSWIVEVKNKQGRGSKLTTSELEQRKRIEAAGMTYHIITSVDEGLAMIGAQA